MNAGRYNSPSPPLKTAIRTSRPVKNELAADVIGCSGGLRLMPNGFYCLTDGPKIKLKMAVLLAGSACTSLNSVEQENCRVMGVPVFRHLISAVPSVDWRHSQTVRGDDGDTRRFSGGIPYNTFSPVTSSRNALMGGCGDETLLRVQH